MARRHTVRLAILVALDQLSPRDLDVLCDSLPVVSDAGCSREEVLAELPGLVAHGYAINHLAGRGGHLYSITAAGRDQVRRDADMDAYIYADRAFGGR